MYKIMIEKSLSQQFTYDVMTTMVESGRDCVWYWANPVSVDRGEEFDVRHIVVTDNDDEADDPANATRCDITPVRVVEAMSKILDGKVNLAAYIVEYIREAVATDDAGCIDAEAADAIAQVIVHDDVIYG